MAPEKKKTAENEGRKSSVGKWIRSAIFLGVLVIIFFMVKRCDDKASENQRLSPGLDTNNQVDIDTGLTRAPESDTQDKDSSVKQDTAIIPFLRKPVLKKKKEPDVVEAPVVSDSIFVYADPWGGRHYDSVTVSLFCRGECYALFSKEDSVNLKSYDSPLKIFVNTTIWIAGINEKSEQSPPVRIDYIIGKKRGNCPEMMMPVEDLGKLICMDVYEWPNKEGERPATYISHKEAEDSCAGAGKRLCSISEWQAACLGPENLIYPYGNSYNENYCPAKELSLVRSGRFPACRSYYGIYDMTGNLWEWTRTPSDSKEGFFFAAGGNWNTGGLATCREKKYSFYPQNRYLIVGFRCCADSH